MAEDSGSTDRPQAIAAPSGNGDRPVNAPVDAESGPQEERIGTFYAFRFLSYRLLWLGDLFLAAAQWIQQTTMGWVVYDLTGSGQILGAISSVSLIPTLFLSPIAGVASDRLRRDRIIVLCQFTMFLTAFLMALGLAFHRVQVWHLFLFTLIMSSAQVLNMPARQTFIFELVPRRIIPNAIALSWFAFSTARAVGPAVGGVLIVMFGPANNFFLQSMAYLTVMSAVLLIRAPAREFPTGRRSFIQGLREGYGFAFSHPLARMMVLMSLISPMLIIPLHAALLPIFAKDTFAANASGLGILVGSIGLGGLFGGLLTASLSRVERRGLLQLIALFIFSLSETTFSILALLTGNLMIAVPFLVLAGAAESFYTTTNTAVLQLLAPEHLRGSMAAVLQLSFLALPLGAPLAGSAADVFGAPAVGATITFTAFCVGLAILIFSPRVRGLRLSQLARPAEQATSLKRMEH